MITTRRAKDRFYQQQAEQQIWMTFNPADQTDPLAQGFGILKTLNENRFPPGEGLEQRFDHDCEILTYVRHGALSHENSVGQSGAILAGEFHLLSSGRGLRHRETNASMTDWVHMLKLQLRPSEPGLERLQEQRRFSAAERRGVLRVVASPDARKQSLRIHSDAWVYSALLDPGQHVVHELAAGRSAWVHVVVGEVLFDGLVLGVGDGVGITGENAVSLTARSEAELLLVDMGPMPNV